MGVVKDRDTERQGESFLFSLCHSRSVLIKRFAKMTNHNDLFGIHSSFTENLATATKCSASTEKCGRAVCQSQTKPEAFFLSYNF